MYGSSPEALLPVIVEFSAAHRAGLAKRGCVRILCLCSVGGGAMTIEQDPSGSGSDYVDYDNPPVAEIELDGTQYRVDVGRGAAVAISQRVGGTWNWKPLAEGRWDGVQLKSKGLDRLLVDALAKALGAAAEQLAGG